MIGLIDCNNFFVSCERLFKPALARVPVVVMSNNDGCAVAMSNEAKLLGITRGLPIFQLRDMIKRHNVITLPGNHRMYGEISARIIATIESVIPDLEVYSVDEAFIHFPELDAKLTELIGREIVTKVRRWVGIPVSMGIASSKTLAKVAARFAKKYPAYRSVCVIDSDTRRRKALELTDIGDIWGIGRRLSARLRNTGIQRAIDFADLSKSEAERMLNVTGMRTWRELNGEPCIDYDAETTVRKQICTTRTFSPCLSGLSQLETAVSRFMAIASRKLRRQKSVAKGISVFIQTNTYRKELSQYSNSAYQMLDEPTSDQMTLIKSALDLLHRIYRDGTLYRRAGVLITETLPVEAMQPSLFSDVRDRNRRRLLNELIDNLNGKSMQNDILKVASATSPNLQVKTEVPAPILIHLKGDK